MRRKTLAVAMLLGVSALMLAPSARAAVAAFPPGFRTENIKTDGATIHVRVGGVGPAVVLLHGFGRHGRHVGAGRGGARRAAIPSSFPICAAWASPPIPRADSTRPTQARDIAQGGTRCTLDKADLVTHDIGNMVGYALAAQCPERITSWVVIDTPLPGIGPWDEIVQSPMLWHFNFRGPDVERLVAGRERNLSVSARPKAHRSAHGVAMRRRSCYRSSGLVRTKAS